MSRARGILTGLLAGAALGACTTTTPVSEADQAFIEQQRDAAIAARERGDLAHARALLHTVALMEPDSSRTSSDLQTLEAAMASAREAALQQAGEAYRRGDRRQGDAWMRRVLSLYPGDAQATASLRDSFTRQAAAQQAAKVEQEYEIQHTPAPPVQAAQDAPEATAREPVPDPAAVQSRIAAANHARTAGDSEQELDYLLAALELDPSADRDLAERISGVRRALSERWYREGSNRFQGDLPGAIAALEKSLAYDPDNHAAKLKLKQARTLLSNLERIQGGG